MKAQTISSAATSMTIQAAKSDVWKKVGFYEHVKKQPTWLLRLSLPVPQEVEGQHGNPGDICRCKYSDGGYLTKRITRIVDESRIEFEIIEQSIRFQHTIKLLGGYIEVERKDDCESIINMVTYYENGIQPKALSAIFIDRVIKTMHRFVIEDMRLQLEGSSMRAATESAAMANS